MKEKLPEIGFTTLITKNLLVGIKINIIYYIGHIVKLQGLRQHCTIIVVIL